jgi:putative zinc finger/helix-turn-helix YgiT family protein
MPLVKRPAREHPRPYCATKHGHQQGHCRQYERHRWCFRAGKVNAAIVDPSFIANVRKKLALDQREAAEIFGGGINAFSRYENGKTKPPLALVKLLRVLDRHPDLLNEVRAT